MRCSDQLTKRRFLLIAFESTLPNLCRTTALLGIYVVSGSAILISRRTLVFLNLELAITKFLPCAFRMFHAYLSTSGLVFERHLAWFLPSDVAILPHSSGLSSSQRFSQQHGSSSAANQMRVSASLVDRSL